MTVVLAAPHALPADEGPEQGDAAQETLRLPAIDVVPASPLDTPSDLSASPGSRTLLDAEALRDGRRGLQLSETLNRVPGVTATGRFNFAQDNRIAIRGFGARAPFGVRGLYIEQDGIPETTPDGQSQVDALDLLNARRITVVRGPAGALRPQAAGGVIQLESEGGETLWRRRQRDPDVPSYALRSDAIVGADGLIVANALLETASDEGHAAIAATRLRMRGFREQLFADRRQLRVSARQRLDERTVLDAQLRWLDAPRTDDAGALTREELAQERRRAAPAATQFDAGQRAEQTSVGLRLERADGWHTLDGLPSNGWAFSAFHTRRSFAQQLPFSGSSQVAFEREHSGLAMERRQTIGPDEHGWQARLRIDYAAQRDDRTRRCVNAALEPSCAPPGAPPTSDLALAQIERAERNGLTVTLDGWLDDRHRLDAALRHDRTRLAIRDRLATAADDDASGQQRFSSTSASLTAEHHRDNGLVVHTRLATAFETPTFTELANPSGRGFAPDVQPQRSRGVEIGLRQSIGAHRLSLVGYTIRTDRELVPFELDGDGRTFFRNAGKTRRQGLEAAWRWTLRDAPGSRWRVESSAAANDHRYLRFERDGERRDGRRLPGLPNHQASLRLRHDTARGFAQAEWLYLGERFADDANRVRVGSQQRLDLTIGGSLNVSPGRAPSGAASVWTWAVTLHDALDQERIDQIRINAAGGRFFEPAPGRQLSVRLTWAWQ